MGRRCRRRVLIGRRLSSHFSFIGKRMNYMNEELRDEILSIPGNDVGAGKGVCYRVELCRLRS